MSYLNNMKAPAIDVNLQYLLQIVALGLWFRLVGTTFHMNHKFVLFTLICSSYICISLTRKKWTQSISTLWIMVAALRNLFDFLTSKLCAFLPTRKFKFHQWWCNFSVMKAFLVNSFNLRPKYCESEETFLRKSYFFWFLSLQHSVHQVHAIVSAVKEWIKIKVFLDESNVILFLQWTMSHLVFVNILRISYDVRILRALLQYYQNILTCCCSCSSLSLCCPRSALSERLTSKHTFSFFVRSLSDL